MSKIMLSYVVFVNWHISSYLRSSFRYEIKLERAQNCLVRSDDHKQLQRI